MIVGGKKFVPQSKVKHLLYGKEIPVVMVKPDFGQNPVSVISLPSLD